MKRVFFDWSRPFLPNVAEYVVENELKRTSKTFDFGDVAFILPGRRAIRTLEAYLQIAVEREIAAGNAAPDWIPPAYWTVGAATEALYTPRQRPAERLTRLLLEADALDSFAKAEPEKTKKLFKALPTDSNWTARLDLAQIFVDLADELATERRDFRSVAASTRRRGLDAETERWETFEKIAERYRNKLADVGETDLNFAREAALKRGEIGVSESDGVEKTFYVVGAVDLNRIQKAFFEALGDRVEFFVFAPETESKRFDEFGCVLPDAWENVALPLPDERMFQVDSPADQAKATALLVGELSKKYESNGNWQYDPIPPEALTIGVPDEEVVPFLEEELRAVGYETIRAQGTPAPQNRVFQLLRNVADYLETRAFSALEELARRPDVDEYLTRNWNFVTLDSGENGDNAAEKELVSSDDGADSALDAESDAAGLLDEEIRRANEAFDETSEEPIFDDDAEPTPKTERDESGEKNDDTSENAASDDPRTPFVPGDWLSEFDRYRATFLPTRVDGRWFEYKNDDAPRQNAEFRLLRKVALLVEKAIEPFCDENVPKIRREETPKAPCAERNAIDAENTDVSALKLDENDLEAARADVFSGEFAFAKDDFSERFRLTTNQRRLPFRDWAPVLSNFLCRIYSDDGDAGRSSEADAQIDAFFAVFNKELDKLEAVPRQLTQETTGAAAIRAVLKELAKAAIPPRPASRVVELQGWLDLPFDDAPNLILTGFNEGIVPTSKTSDLFLPNEARRELGLDDARRRFARDVYLTSALAASKRNFFVVFGRRTLQGDPKTPSRFAFATEPERVPERICRFFAKNGSGDLEKLLERQEGRPFCASPTHDAETTTVRPTSTALDFPEIITFGASPVPSGPMKLKRPIGFCVPILRFSGSPPNKMKATEFRDFLACPYRYFLRFALKLRAAATETSTEMSAAAFGTIAHDALRDFGAAPEIRDSVDSDEIAAWLGARLDDVARRYFNELTSPFVRIQLEQIRTRLEAFARWQASWRRSGRQIRFVETAPESGAISFDVGDGRPVEIYGRLDRIDYDPRENRWFVFDYKTFDVAKEGRKAPLADENDSALCADVVDDETGTTLFSTRIGNVADEKHRKRSKPRPTAPIRTLEKHGLKTDAADEIPGPAFDWIDLQLPLYRRFFHRILFEYYRGERAWKDVETSKVSLGYIALTKSSKTQAFGGPWTERDLRAADATVAQVVRTIRRLWRGPIDPNAYLDPNDPSRGTVLASKAPAFSEELSPITLDFLKE